MLAVGRADPPLPVCITPAITQDALNAAIAGDVTAFPENIIVDERSVATELEREEILQVLDQVVACSNAGEPLRVWSLYSPGYLARMFQIQGPFDDDLYAAFAEPRPVAVGKGMEIAEVRAIWLRSDGLYGADVVMRYPSVPMPKQIVFWLTGDGWLIEEITGEISFSLP